MLTSTLLTNVDHAAAILLPLQVLLASALIATIKIHFLAMVSKLIKTIGSKMLVLSEKDVRMCLTMADCLDINRKALMSIASPESAAQVGGVGNVPARLGLRGPLSPAAAASGAAEDWTLIKPASFDATNSATASLMGMKIVSIRSQNPNRGLPLVPATVLVLDAESGIVQAILNATYLTGARTAASSGLATQLARPDAKHLVVFGAGLQAECHIEAIETAIGRTLPKITIVNRTRERAEALKQKILSDTNASRDIEVVWLGDDSHVQSALSTADVVAATTNATTPLFDGSILPTGCHVNGIGSYTPDMQEISPSVVNRSRILIDTNDAKTVGDLKPFLEDNNNNKHPMTLLGDALAGTAGESWSSQDPQYDCTFFKGVGTAIQDVMTADFVVKKARELGIGTDVDMS